jgi:hypothetical protein
MMIFGFHPATLTNTFSIADGKGAHDAPVPECRTQCDVSKAAGGADGPMRRLNPKNPLQQRTRFFNKKFKLSETQ